MAMFTASRTQVATYLLGVCPFSIAFLVFLNSSVSFVITDLIGKHDGVGDAVGNLGFADELVALVACPIWGLLSDRIGVRWVCCLGYILIGVALFAFVQAKNVYPDLLLGRLFFSLASANISTMVTAILPSMSFVEETGKKPPLPRRQQSRNGHAHTPSVASELTITPSNYLTVRAEPNSASQPTQQPDHASKIAGFVARFQKAGVDPARALQYSYYVVAAVALLLFLVSLLGLRGLQSEKDKGWATLRPGSKRDQPKPSIRETASSLAASIRQAFLAGFTRRDIFIGYVGGFVARASSVGISLFIPLLVNAVFLSSDLCEPQKALDRPAGLPDVKRRCPRAYVVAAELTGVSQLIALLCAPLFGYWASRLTNKTIPLMVAAVAGIVGYPVFAAFFDAHDDNKSARAVAFVSVCLIGISQIGAIVSSLSILSNGVLKQTTTNAPNPNSSTNERSTDTEAAPLLGESVSSSKAAPSLAELKGSIAGVYSFYGGAGILLLTKVGGALFDSITKAAPFYMMASFNAILLICALATSFRTEPLQR
ncbi:hypothetical protein LTS08_000365 [Lithohypha guttulata]|nr:hypothetical protein LTS08_000365 [Lithohypha guttulata]